MEPVILDETVAQLRAALQRNDLSQASQIVEALRPADQADLFHDLDDIQQKKLLPKLNPADAADIFEELYDEEAAELAVQLPLGTLIRIVNEMEPDEAADLLDDLTPQQAEPVLAKIKAAHRIQKLIRYDDDTAGGLMTTIPVAIERRMTADQAIEAIRGWNPDDEMTYFLFPTDKLGRLVGVISLRQLIIAPRNRPIAEFMDTDVVYATYDTDQEDCADLMLRYDLLALPVVDENDILLGVITVDDLVDVIQEEASEDIQRLGGAEPLDRAYLDTNILLITQKRIGWLFMLFGTATLTGWVMDLYANQIEAVLALTIFIPMLIGTGGNAGSQTTATIIRAIAVGDVEWEDGFRVWWHEFRVGMILGVCMAIIAFGLAYLWVGDERLAVTVSVSIMVIVLWATGAGSLLPLIATRLGVDPTVVSGPVMSTLVDATGLFIYFNIAKFILEI
ncbi:magnesium transporter [Anaerolineales bacterium HSG6]|nr:magnesium transporter [Anaerolineales bacterium HSG6]MDM8530473.1 magnesium transporter [Anaerolineales bacterium HSG25]